MRPPVTYYLDDTPIGVSGSWAYASSLGLDLPTYDLERFEVLRGPQGTLYGAGSEIGVIKYVFKQPNVSDFEARVGVDGSTIHGASKMGGSAQAMLNAPLVQGLLGVRVSAYDSYTPGYIDNLYSGAKGTNVLRQYGGRIATLWQPTESVSVTIKALLHRIEADSSADVVTPGAATVPNTGAAWFLRRWDPMGTSQLELPFWHPRARASTSTPRRRTGSLGPLNSSPPRPGRATVFSMTPTRAP